MTPETRPVGKAVLPVAGLGTRFRPATKELLSIIEKPIIQYAVEEAGNALMMAGSAIAQKPTDNSNNFSRRSNHVYG